MLRSIIFWTNKSLTISFIQKTMLGNKPGWCPGTAHHYRSRFFTTTTITFQNLSIHAQTWPIFNTNTDADTQTQKPVWSHLFKLKYSAQIQKPVCPHLPMLKLSSCSSPRRAGSKLSSWLPTDEIYDDIYGDIYDNSDLMLIARPAMTILCLWGSFSSQEENSRTWKRNKNAVELL